MPTLLARTWGKSSRMAVSITIPEPEKRFTADAQIISIDNGSRTCFRCLSTDAQQDPNYKVRPDATDQGADQPIPKEQQ